MKRSTIIFFIIVIQSTLLFAQNFDKNWGAGIEYGSIEYRGELGDQLGDFSQWQGGYGFHISRYLSPAINVGARIGYNYLSVMGPDTNTYNMNGDMYTLTGNIELKFANGITMPEDGIFKPYVKLGGGKLYGDTWGSSMDNDGKPYKLHLDDWVYFLSGGTKIRLSKHIDAFVEVGNLWVTALGMDGSAMDPASDQFIQVNVGVTLSIGQFKDKDRDGVSDQNDKCPTTPKGVIVDMDGCPVDSDSDGIPDYVDDCPDKYGLKEANGCPDRDEDGIADKKDKCPDEYGPKSNQGCPFEPKKVDGDTKDTPIQQGSGMPASGVNIFFVYPGNGNGQGMPQIYSMAQGQNVMPFDSDGDGISDNIDQCPNQAGTVENYGCPTSDIDTTNHLNSHNKQQSSAFMQPGCPSDRDCDGISDNYDNCPDSPGSIRNKGCPIEQLSPQWRRDINTSPVHFMTAKTFLTDYSRANVDKLISTMKAHNELNVWLFGHTDPRGSDDYNAALSEDRLRTIVSYMVEQGISKERIYTMAMGESFPAALGKSEAEMKLNRRVDFYLFEFK